MKVQCSCGTKYAFDVTPEMARNPIQLVCQNCGADISGFVNQLIQQELQAMQVEAEHAETVPIIPASAPPAPAPAAPSKPQIRISTPVRKTEAAAAGASTTEMPICLKHPPQRTTHKCRVCQKPICPECMALFGYVCSPLCRVKAESHGITIPVYEGQRSVVEARHWRKVGLAAVGVAAVVIALIGLWVWYVYAGCMPRPYFSVHFPERSYSGESAFCGNQQIVFLHGVTLARYDTKQDKQIWSRDLVTVKELGAEYSALGGEELKKVLGWAGEEFRLKVSGQNVWVVAPGKMTRYDWDTGEPRQEILLTGGNEAVLQSDEVLVIGNEPGRRAITHISLTNGEKRVEEVNESALAGKPHRTSLATTRQLPRQSFAGLPTSSSGKNLSAPLDPAKVAAQVQSLSMPARIALPATLSTAWEQERIMTEVNDEGDAVPHPTAVAKAAAPAESYSLIPLKDGCLQFSVRLLEEKLVTRSAMKERSGKSALEGAKATDTAAVANEIFNDMQRDRGGDKVTENQSRYWVTLRRADANVQSEWVGEVTGPPGLIPLETVNILVAGNSLRVFDKANKKLWETKLTFNVPLNSYGGDADTSFGAGPCVERGGVLYVADQGVLTAFDLTNGDARWRLPTVGVTGMFFDAGGMIYINTTTANLDSIKYSRQVDVTQKIDPVIMKVDPRSGKTLWSAKPGGFINYISGKYVYIVTTYAGDLDENGEVAGIPTGMERAASMRIKRLDPKNGRVLWEYSQPRCPLDVKFQDNHIQLVFRKEVQALKFLTF